MQYQCNTLKTKSKYVNVATDWATSVKISHVLMQFGNWRQGIHTIQLLWLSPHCKE